MRQISRIPFLHYTTKIIVKAEFAINSISNFDICNDNVWPTLQ